MYDPSKEANAGLVQLDKVLAMHAERKRYRGYLFRNSGYLNIQRKSASTFYANQMRWQAFVKMVMEADYWGKKKPS